MKEEMKYGLFPCCSPPVLLVQYETSTRAVLAKLGVEFMEIKDFNCCGYPLRNLSFKAFALSSARNLALAEKNHVNIVTVCNCCFGNLKHVDHLMKEDPALADEINETLGKEGLEYKGTGSVRPRHLLDVIYNQVGIEKLKEKIQRTYRGLKIATHYGCHLLRPSKVVEFDNPLSPTIFDELVEVTGAESIPWKTKLDCCGAPVFGIEDDLAMDLTEKKIKDAKQSGADYVCVACPFCHIQFDRVQLSRPRRLGTRYYLPSVLYPQLLGLCMGVDDKTLGLDMNELDASGLKQFLS